VVLYFGGAGFVFAGLMAATSNDAAVRLLGARGWKALHATGAWVLFVIFFQSYLLRGFISPGFLPASLAVVAALVLRIAGRRRAADVAGDQRSKRRLASA
jgi:DMSO/TMAO reductase YedYZ heme-binding membrane subunit